MPDEGEMLWSTCHSRAYYVSLSFSGSTRESIKKQAGCWLWDGLPDRSPAMTGTTGGAPSGWGVSLYGAMNPAMLWRRYDWESALKIEYNKAGYFSRFICFRVKCKLSHTFAEALWVSLRGIDSFIPPVTIKSLFIVWRCPFLQLSLDCIYG